jgi:hypothetical protein
VSLFIFFVSGLLFIQCKYLTGQLKYSQRKLKVDIKQTQKSYYYFTGAGEDRVHRYEMQIKTVIFFVRIFSPDSAGIVGKFKKDSRGFSRYLRVKFFYY